MFPQLTLDGAQLWLQTGAAAPSDMAGVTLAQLKEEITVAFGVLFCQLLWQAGIALVSLTTVLTSVRPDVFVTPDPRHGYGIGDGVRGASPPPQCD